jgi:hypothetical protein
MAVLPVFFLRHPAEGRQPAFRFLFWFGLVFVLAFVDSAIRSGDPLLPVGLALASVGTGAFVGAVIWALAAILRTAAASWRVSKDPMKPRIVLILRDGLVAAKTPALLAVVSAIVWFGGVAAYGDLLIDRHPMARSRSWFDVLSGCGWSPLFGAALRLKSTIPKEQRLASFRFNPTETAALQPTGIPGHDFGAAVALAKASVLAWIPTGNN